MEIGRDDDLLAPDEYLIHEVLEELVAGLGCVNGGLSEALVERADVCLSSRLTVEGERPKRSAISRIERPWTRHPKMSMHSYKDKNRLLTR